MFEGFDFTWQKEQAQLRTFQQLSLKSDLAVLILIINWLRQTEKEKKEKSKRARDRKTHRGDTERWIPMPNRSA